MHKSGHTKVCGNVPQSHIPCHNTVQKLIDKFRKTDQLLMCGDPAGHEC
jgi:hypothetical protein